MKKQKSRKKQKIGKINEGMGRKKQNFVCICVSSRLVRRQNEGLDEQGEDGKTSSSWNGATSDADHESVLSMTMESEASNVAVKVINCD